MSQSPSHKIRFRGWGRNLKGHRVWTGVCGACGGETDQDLEYIDSTGTDAIHGLRRGWIRLHDFCPGKCPEEVFFDFNWEMVKELYRQGIVLRTKGEFQDDSRLDPG